MKLLPSTKKDRSVAIDDKTLVKSASITRVITIQGPSDWVQDFYNDDLAEGVHVVDERHGIPCLIIVQETETAVHRSSVGQVTNAELTKLATNDPDGYDALHGPGASDHVSDVMKRWRDRDTTTPPVPTTGGYI